MAGLRSTSDQHRDWRPDVAGVVREIEARWPHLECITYRDHPWPGWDGRSLDVWRDASMWLPARLQDLVAVRTYLMQRERPPTIRHTILAHRLWTSWGGYSVWNSDDHSGKLRHLHCTYW